MRWSFFEGGGLKRMDFKETNPYSRSRALSAAFRYHKQPDSSVRVDVPRAGKSYHFVRPLVLDEEIRVRFTYKLQ